MPPARPQSGGAGGGAARQRGREGTPGFLGRCQPSARRWNFEPEKVWCFSRPVLLREEERFVDWGLWGGARSRQFSLPQVCRVKANSCRGWEGPSAPCSSEAAGCTPGRWGLGRSSGFKGHSRKPQSCYLGDRWGWAGGGGYRAEFRPQRQPAAVGWTESRPH